METLFLILMILSLIIVLTIDTVQKRRSFLHEGNQE
jgi:hypothetical protein